MPNAVHNTTVEHDATPRSEAADVQHSPSRSQRSITTHGTKRKDRNLDNFDETATTPQPLINSPRSLLACAKEGVDPAVDLVYRDVKSFVLASKGDGEIARRKHRHYEDRRLELLLMCRERRRAAIAEQEERERSTAEEAAPRRAATPAVASTAALTSTTNDKSEFQSQSKPPPQKNSRSRDDALTSGDDECSDLGHSQPRAHNNNQVLSPEEFQKMKAEQKKAKVARQVDKMKRVMEKNQQREANQLEHLEAMKRKMKQQEVERQQQLEREEVLRYLRDRDARKRDAELAVQRELRDVATAARMEKLRNEREARVAEMRRKDEERARKDEEKRKQREHESAVRRDLQQQRLDDIYHHNELIIEERAEDLAERMAQADELRARLEKQRDAELEERKRENARKQAENEAKRRQADENFNAKLGGYKQRAANAEKIRLKREERQKHLVELKRMEDAEDAMRRLELREQVVKQELDHQLALQKRLAEEDAKRMDAARARDREAKLRLAEKEMIVEDRVALVQRMQRRAEQECEEAAERYEAKMQRIQKLRDDVVSMDEERKKLQAEMVKLRPPPGAFDKPTPGPGEYAVMDADRKLRVGPSVKMGAVPAKAKLLPVDLPGPGAYGNPIQAIRSSKGAKLPPRHVPAAAGNRSASSMSSRLPSIKGSPSKTEPTPARSHTAMARPAELRDEDFNTDDEFD